MKEPGFWAKLKDLPRLLKADPALFSEWDAGPRGARRSFWLMLTALPAYAVMTFVVMAPQLSPTPLRALLPTLAIDYVLQWTLFPLATWQLLRLGRMETQAFPAFVTVNNWLSFFNAVFALLPLLLFVAGGIDGNILYALLNGQYLAIAFVVSIWGARLFPGGFAIGTLLFFLNTALGEAVSAATLELVRRHSGN